MTDATTARGGVPQVEPGHVIPGRTLWLVAVVVLLAALVSVAAYLWLRRPAVVERPVATAPAPLTPEMQARVRQLEALNRSLEEEIARRGTPPAPLSCPPGMLPVTPGTPLPSTPPSGTPLPERSGLAPLQPPSGKPGERVVLPADGATPAVPPAALAALPTAPPLPPAGTATPPADPAVLPVLPTPELLQRLEKATALVIAEDGIATGFFIADDLLATNRHAVEGAKGGKVMVASRSLGTVQPARVVGRSPDGPVGAPDFALVRLTKGKAPGVLPISPRIAKLVNIVAAGYPGLIVQNDAGFRRLVAGDASAAPDLNVTQGAIQAIQTLPTGVTALVHTASILQGNSGGPLVDTCGRVVGINTFIAVDEKQSGRISYAQPADALLAFIASKATPPTPDPRACAQ